MSNDPFYAGAATRRRKEKSDKEMDTTASMAAAEAVTLVMDEMMKSRLNQEGLKDSTHRALSYYLAGKLTMRAVMDFSHNSLQRFELVAVTNKGEQISLAEANYVETSTEH
ncbi:MAG: hypothetical protein KDI33_09205 [Halioglobus sp.]|nr:hypothetical protein [Halioglobus sp.]